MQFITDSLRIIDLSIIKVVKFRTVILCILYLSLDLWSLCILKAIFTSYSPLGGFCIWHFIWHPYIRNQMYLSPLGCMGFSLLVSTYKAPLLFGLAKLTSSGLCKVRWFYLILFRTRASQSENFAVQSFRTLDLVCTAKHYIFTSSYHKTEGKLHLLVS